MSFFIRTAVVFLFISLLYAAPLRAQSHDRGVESLQLELWPEAIQYFTDATRANPGDMDAHLMLGNAYLGKGDTDNAKAAFEAGAKANPDAALSMVANGRVAMINGDAAGAESQFTRAAKVGKKDINVWRSIGESYLYFTPKGRQSPDYTRAEAKLKEAVDFNSKDYRSLMSMAYCYKEMQNGGLAAQYYEYAMGVEKNSALPRLMLAKTYKAAKLVDKSAVYLDQAIATDPAHLPSHRMRAEGYYFDKRFDKSKAAYEEMFAKTTGYSVEDRMFYANTLYLTKDYEQCVKEVEQIIKKDNSKAYLKRLLGYSYYETGDYQKGMAIMEEYFRSKPENVLPSDHLYMGRLMVKTGGDPERAIKEMQKAIEMDPTYWTAQQEIADVYYASKDYCSAATAYAAYIDSSDAPDPTDYYKLGLCQYYCKDDADRYQKAAASFAKLSELAPTAGTSWYWRAKAEAKLEPDVEADPSMVAAFGIARNSYERYAEIAAADPVKNQKNLTEAYEYLLYYHYKRGCKDPFNYVLGELLKLDASNETANGLKGNVDASGMPATPPGIQCN